MFVFNLTLNRKTLKKALSLTCCVLCLFILTFGFYLAKSQKIYVKDDMQASNNLNLSISNYSDILQDCYNNLDSYVGKTVKFSGFIYKLYDFSDEQFVLGREMITKKISETQAQSVVIGFLCESKKTKNFKPGEWVEIEGTIEKGYYHADIPIIKVKKITKIDEPSDKYVNCPTNMQVSPSTTT